MGFPGLTSIKQRITRTKTHTFPVFVHFHAVVHPETINIYKAQSWNKSVKLSIVRLNFSFLTLFILMDFPILLDRISMELPNWYLWGDR